MIAFEASDMTKAYVGSTEVSKAYLGDELVWGGESPVLPYDAEIEYLESSGTQEIDTGVYPNANVGVFGTVMRLNNDGGTNDKIFLGCTENGLYDRGRGFGVAFITGFYMLNSFVRPITTPDINSLITFSMNYLNDNIGSFNSETITLGTKTGDYTNKSIRLFNFYQKDNTHSKYSVTKVRFYNVKFSVEENLVRDFIPVRVGATGYMYDRISRQLFGNSGTGSFVLGPDVS